MNCFPNRAASAYAGVCALPNSATDQINVVWLNEPEGWFWERRGSDGKMYGNGPFRTSYSAWVDGFYQGEEP